MRPVPATGDACPMNVIEVTNLVKSYGDQVAVDGVSFSVEEGEILAILGPNGAGKTTTVESISGLREPDSGTISVLGLDPRRDRDELREQVGVQLQESELPAKLRVGEAARPVRRLLPRTRRTATRSSGASASPTSAKPNSGTCRAARSSACPSPWPSSATRGSRSSTSSRPASTRRLAATRGSSSRMSGRGASRSSS